jgi:hypothetical protein
MAQHIPDAQFILHHKDSNSDDLCKQKQKKKKCKKIERIKIQLKKKGKPIIQNL